MKKIITMILTFAVVISAVTVPSDKANAEEAVPTYIPVPTQTPAPQDHENIYVSGWGHCEDGETAPVTKGFSLNLSLSGYYKGSVQWTSSKPNIASINAKGKVTGKKCGKTTITAEYGGTKSYITVKVVKNEYSTKDDIDINEVSSVEEITSMKFDKKGNLKCVFTAMDKLSKAEIKKAKKDGSIELYDPKSKRAYSPSGGMKLVIKNNKGKVLLKKTIRNNWATFAYKPGLNKLRDTKFTVKKKYLKKLKGVDLRTCTVTFM